MASIVPGLQTRAWHASLAQMNKVEEARGRTASSGAFDGVLREEEKEKKKRKKKERGGTGNICSRLCKDPKARRPRKIESGQESRKYGEEGAGRWAKDDGSEGKIGRRR